MKINSIESVDNNAVETNTTTASGTTSNNNLNIDYKELAQVLAQVMSGNGAKGTPTTTNNVASGNLDDKKVMRFDETEEDYINRRADEKIAKEKESQELKALCDRFVDKEYVEATDKYFTSQEDKEKVLKALALEGMLLKFDNNSLLSRVSGGNKPYKLLVNGDDALAEEFLKLGSGENPKLKAELRANHINKYWHLKQKIENAVAIQEKSIASNEAYAQAFKRNEDSLQTQFIKRSASRFNLKGY